MIERTAHLFTAHFLPDELSVEIAENESILEASLRSGIAHAHACGGHARCSTCRIMVLEGLNNCLPRNEKEEALTQRLGFDDHIRLACQTRVTGAVRLRRLVLDDEDLQLTNQLAADAALPGSVGDEKRIAILFADIRGFTSFAEALPAYDVVHVLNRYFHQMTRVITGRDGCVDNYMGDGLMAVFGLEKSEEAAMQAVSAALEMLAAVEDLKPYLREVYRRDFDIGVGIHYGEAVVGAVGFGSRKRVTAIGDAVNLASRIESANKQAGTRLLVSEEAHAEVSSRVRIGRSLRISIPGKSGEHSLYEVLGLQ